MAILTATFQTGVNGNTIATGDAGSATAWNAVTISGSPTNTLTYDTAHAYESLAMKAAVNAGGGNAYAQWTTALGTVTDHYGRFYLYMTANPPSNHPICQVSQSGSRAARFDINGTGKIVAFDNPAASITTTNSIALNQWVRIEFHVIHSATVGQIEIKLFNDPDSVTPTETKTSTANMDTLANANEILFGALSGQANVTLWMDNILANATGYPGPWVDESILQIPTFTCEVAFATNPGATPTWTNVSDYLIGFHIQRGRQKELDRVDAGRATVRLDNSDRRFDPTHGSSPYSPNVLPMRRLRLYATHNAVTYHLFSGFVESWPQSWQGPNAGFSEVTVTDAFLPLSKADVGEGTEWPREYSGARITRILDAAGWPAADRAIDTGYSEIAGAIFPLGSGATALDAIRETADADLGLFFCDGQGRAVFHDRHHRRKGAYLTSQETFADANTTGLDYKTIVLDTDAARIWNDIQINTPGSDPQQVEDSTSQTKYLRRTLARSVPLARDTEAADQAAFLLATYKDPRYQLDGIAITPTSNDQWEQVLGRELGDHITVKRHPQLVGTAITQECSIEAIEHRGSPGFWETRWLLSTPAFSAVDWWILADSEHGDLAGATTRIPY